MHKGYDRELKNLTEAWNKQDKRLTKIMYESSGKDLIDDFEFGSLDDALKELPKTSITTGADESIVHEDDESSNADTLIAKKIGNKATSYEEWYAR